MLPLPAYFANSSIFCLIALLLLCTGRATADAVSCGTLSHNCSLCESNGCKWCPGEGRSNCTAKDANTTCATNASACGAQHREERQAVICEAINTCSACAAVAGCKVCVDPVTHVSKCSGSANCAVDPYNVQWEWWIPRAGLSTAAFTQSTCPIMRPAASDSPTLVIKFKVFIVQPGGTVPEGLFIGSLVNYIARFFGAGKVTAENILIQSYTLSPPAKRRQTLDTTDRDATVYVNFADAADFTAQGIAATLLNGYTDNTVALAPGSVPVTVNPYTPTVGAGSVYNRSSGGGDSGGGSVATWAIVVIVLLSVGCAVLVAVIVYLLQSRHPQAK